MPVITSQARPLAIKEDTYIAPKKTITHSTGMDLKQTVSGAPPKDTPNRQPSASEDTKPNGESTPKEVTLSPQLSALARKEQKFREQEQTLKAERDAFAAEKAEYTKLKDFKTKLEAKDYSVLDEQGVSYEEWTNYLINKGESTKPEVQAINELKQEIAGIKAATEQNVSKQYEATINQYRRDIKNLVESDPSFDSIKSQKAEEHVLQHILDTFNEDGEILSVEEAAKEIEDYIVDEALEMSKLKKVQERLQATQSEKRLPPPKTSMRTLTNQVTQSTPSVERGQFQHLTMKERIARAVARSQKS